mmetsp:Transcript_28549/g.64745  ORF Transcript_28549/g.64745 Transcript_28549/m.64745 type:complete len:316 (+) Transcript_28549:23-970(+)
MAHNVISSLSHPSLQRALRLVTKSGRGSQRQVLVGGRKLVHELGDTFPIRELFVRKPLADDHDLNFEICHVVSKKVLATLANLPDLEDGVVGSFDMPAVVTTMEHARVVVAIDGVTDFGVLGTVLRTAWALQWQGVYVLDNCCDIWHPLAVRASQGALFTVPYMTGKPEDFYRWLSVAKLKPLTLDPAAPPLESAEFQETFGVCLVVRGSRASPVVGLGKNLRGVPVDGVPTPQDLDLPVSAGIHMAQIKQRFFPQVSRSPYLASPETRAKTRLRLEQKEALKRMELENRMRGSAAPLPSLEETYAEEERDPWDD